MVDPDAFDSGILVFSSQDELQRVWKERLLILDEKVEISLTKYEEELERINDAWENYLTQLI
jgi:hypothetical protein